MSRRQEALFLVYFNLILVYLSGDGIAKQFFIAASIMSFIVNLIEAYIERQDKRQKT